MNRFLAWLESYLPLFQDVPTLLLSCKIAKEMANVPEEERKPIHDYFFLRLLNASESIIHKIAMLRKRKRQLMKATLAAGEQPQRHTSTAFRYKIITLLILLNRVIGGFLVLLHDYYLVARLFRTFTDDDRVYTSRYVMIYVGDEHAENVRGALEDLGYSEDWFESDDPPTIVQCVNIAGLPDPANFFS